MPTSHRRPANKHSKHKTRRRKTQHQLLRGMLFVFAVLMLCFGLFLWKAALELNAPAEPAVSASEDDFRPVVGDPPYRVAIDAGHGGSDPGARGVVEEKQITAATAAALLQWLEQDPNYIPLQTRESFDETATPAQRAAAASAQNPQLLLSIHGNSAANGSTASGFECYPAVPGRTWHQESFYFARLLAGGMQSIGAKLRGRGGVRYIYYLENDQKQLVELREINDIMNNVVKGWKSFSNPRHFPKPYLRQKGWERELPDNGEADNGDGRFIPLSDAELEQMELPEGWR